MKKLFLTLLAVVAFFTLSFSQSEKLTDTVFYSGEMVFYGYDYSHFQLVDGKRMTQDIKKFIFGWNDFLDVKLNKRVLASLFRKDRVTINQEPTDEKNRPLRSSELVSTARTIISKDSIQSYLSNYNFREKDGLGFVVIFENFEKESKSISGYFVFFDIATKKVIKADYFNSFDRNGYNRVNDWAIATVIAMKKYSKLYKKKYIGPRNPLYYPLNP